MAKKTLTVGLSATEIDKAIQEVNRIKQRLNLAVKNLLNELVNEGKQIARIEVASLGAIDTGELENSIDGYYDESRGIGVIFTDCPYAIYVEYGTGIEGARKPHPQPIGWNYDGNGHGDSGWWYYSEKDGEIHWTKGMPSRPFMYNTKELLQQRLKSIALKEFEVTIK